MEFIALDRRDRRSQWYLLAALLGGAVVGFVGAGLSGRAPYWFMAVYDPYVIMALAVIVGAGAAGFGWALLNSSMAAFGALVGQITAGSAILHDAPFAGLGSAPGGLVAGLTIITMLGPLSYGATRCDRVGGVCYGLASGLLLSVAAEEMLALTEEWPYALAASAILGMGFLLLFRRRLADRLLGAVLGLAYTVGYGLVLQSL
ncbi:hypothetical protein FDA94_27885 [Herbidospora galbida]|uniref:Uncharacterized protein n=1 Tax=Herbidospora galbida TaxID=2575442 RepID=A0A4V5UZZ8_9ACTN|nr:hypothetical protein [Herbidospora galbida]TKK85003.1 hypothetical protein FDA94_27885 [Herbidospora galbida]